VSDERAAAASSPHVRKKRQRRRQDILHAALRAFREHGYHDAIIFGHALEGNLHFVFKQDFNKQSEVDRYGAFINDLTSIVVNTYDGSLKAEHGTGRNMAPFVELEWGAEACAIMKEIKDIFDAQFHRVHFFTLNKTLYKARLHLKS